MSHGYVIYVNGLDGYEPNWYATHQGDTYMFRLFDKRSTDNRSSYYKFTSYLYKIAQQAAGNEKAYLTQKIEQLRSTEIDVDYLDKIQAALEAGQYGAAYTLLMRRDKDLQRLKEEIASKRFKSFSKTNEFFGSQFSKFIQDKFEAQLSQQGGLERFVSIDADFESIVDEFLSSVFNLSIDDNASLQYIRNQLIQGLREVAKKSGGRIYYSATLDKVGKGIKLEQKGTKKYTSSDAVITKKGQFRSYGALARRLAQDLMADIGRGLSTELYTIAAQRDVGGRSFATGNLMKQKTNAYTGRSSKVQGKGDVRTIDCMSVEVNIDKIIQSLYADGLDDQSQEFWTQLEEKLKEAAAISGADIFDIQTNVKGYVSNYDLQVEGAGSFAQRLSTLSGVKLGGNMTNKLIFMLNNTTKGCIAEGRQGEIADYIAAVCVAWMWDNSEEIFQLGDIKVPQYKKIYLFNSGGAYYTASQIIQQTLNRLMNYGEDNNMFVDVTITPPSVFTGYSALVEANPLNLSNSWDEWQSTLQEMWETVKANAMATGQMAIHFNQRELNELLSDLKGILNS